MADQLATGIAPSAQAVLSAVSLAAVSQHRLWLAVPEEAGRKAIATTPGAASALFDAVRAVQKKRDPLFTVYADTWIAARSPRITAR